MCLLLTTSLSKNGCDYAGDKMCGDGFGYCIRGEYWCDGSQDCLDNSDEVNCTSTTIPPSGLNVCTQDNPCRNGGICISMGHDWYTCICVGSYTGFNCERQVDNCESKPCVNNGICKDMGNGFQCQCPQGFYGRQCENDALPCRSNPCLYGGTCMENEHSYHCFCKPGHKGLNCDKEITECLTPPCHNGSPRVLEKGSRANISCNMRFHVTFIMDGDITWERRDETDAITVTSCSIDSNICVDNMPDRYHGEFEKAENELTTHLVISSVSTNETEFGCSYKQITYPITIDVYARPTGPTCKPVAVDDTKRNLVFTCRASNVYPSINALINIRGFSKDDLFFSHCSNVEDDSLNPGTYVAECVWRIPAAKFDPIKYSYYVKMYPKLPHIKGMNVPYVVSQNYTLQLSIPTAVIDYTQCPVGRGVRNGKITNSSTASCRCVLESTGFPIGQATWYTYNGNESVGIDDTEDGSSNLVINPHIHGQSYQCRAWSPLRKSLIWGPVYTPTFEKPSSDPEPISLRIDVAAGIVAGTAALTVIVAVVVWKWRSRKRQAADVAYSKSCLDDGAVIYKPQSSGDKANLFLLN
ncbi:hypothetical protein BsWGS_12392 [Bradybaena similaris]